MTVHEALREVIPRVVRIAEAHDDCDHDFVRIALADLVDDLWRSIGAAEQAEDER